MPLDSSIITNMQQPDFSQAISTGINMKAMATQNQMNSIKAQEAKQQFNDSNALRQATADNTTVDENGKASFDRGGYMSDLGDKAPQLAQQEQIKFNAQDRSVQEANIKQENDRHTMVAQLASSAHDQPSWDAAIAKAGTLGIPTDQIPKQFDPDVRNNIIFSSMNAKDQNEAQNKQKELAIQTQSEQNKATELRMAMAKQYGSSIPKNTNADTDPATLIKNMPEAMQKDAAKEIANKQNLANVAPSIMDSFHKAADTLHAVDFIPNLNPMGESYKNADQESFKTKLGSLFNDVEDKDVKQQKINQAYEETVPKFGDPEYRLQQKADALKTLVMGKASAPIFKSSTGHDLSEFTRTKIDPKIFERPGSKAPPDDVASYAKAHGITIDQAQSIKQQRMVGKY